MTHISPPDTRTALTGLRYTIRQYRLARQQNRLSKMILEIVRAAAASGDHDFICAAKGLVDAYVASVRKDLG